MHVLLVKADNGSQTESIVGDSDEYKWLKELEKEEKLLQEEAVEHGDILLVDVVDVYRNIPAKMKSTYEWLVVMWFIHVLFAFIATVCRISRHIDFRYLLKTDDDCFVHIEQILKVCTYKHLWQQILLLLFVSAGLKRISVG